MIEFRDALTDLTDEFGTDDGGFEGELPEGQHFRVENKNFYFDIGQNNRGVYMRISEVKTNFRYEMKYEGKGHDANYLRFQKRHYYPREVMGKVPRCL